MSVSKKFITEKAEGWIRQEMRLKKLKGDRDLAMEAGNKKKARELNMEIDYLRKKSEARRKEASEWTGGLFGKTTKHIAKYAHAARKADRDYAESKRRRGM